MSPLQGVERLAKRRDCQNGRIAPPLICIDLRVAFIE
jgi:hypothetical protein